MSACNFIEVYIGNTAIIWIEAPVRRDHTTCLTVPFKNDIKHIV